jgi:hypothetical protein
MVTPINMPPHGHTHPLPTLALGTVFHVKQTDNADPQVRQFFGTINQPWIRHQQRQAQCHQRCDAAKARYVFRETNRRRFPNRTTEWKGSEHLKP